MMRFLVVAVSLLLSSVPAVAQVATGSYAFGAFDNHGFDSVNVGNLNVHFGVPIINKSGRGLPFYYNLSYDSSVWYPNSASGSNVWTPVQSFGWRGDTEIATGYLTYSDFPYSRGTVGGGREIPACTGEVVSNWVYHDSTGVSHAFTARTSYYEDNTANGTGHCPTSVPNSSSLARDGSGYTLSVTDTFNASLTSAAGKTISPPISNSGSGVVTDANGNQVSTDGNGNFKDTTGKVVLQVAGNAPNPQTFTYTDTTGASRAVTVNYKTYTVQTNFGCSGIGDQGATPTSLIDTISLPDGQSVYHFSYETTPGYPNSVTGRLATVTLPGGGVIGYTYTGANNGIVCADGSAAGLTRTMLSDSPNTSWTYTRAPSTATSHTDVVDGLNNHLNYDFVAATVPSGAQQLGAYFYEVNRNAWNGAASGTTVLTRASCYNGSATPCTTTAINLPVAQLDTYETLDGVQERGATVYYNANGLQTQQKTYDFQASGARGALLSTEYWNYPSSGIANLLSSDTVFDGSSNQLSGTSYTYDETTGPGHAALVTTSNLPQHTAVGSAQRGNLTTVSQWHWTSGAYTATASLAYDDAGQAVSKMDGRNYTTSYTYDPATDAFPLKTTYPTPSSNVAIGTGTQYDAMTGVLLSSTDPNSQATTYKTYDALLRPTEVDYPDGGQSLYAYTTPTEVKVSRLRQGSNYIVSIADTDGYGRQSLVTLKDPSDGDTLVNYTYDGNGNALSVTNPHRSGASGTDGTTTYAYDVLGRLTLQTQPDSSTKGSKYNGNTVTLTDEAGNQWKQTADGAGRPTQVLEPSTASKAPLIETDYTYGGLTSYVSQKGTGGEAARTRSFMSDGAGHQLLAVTPEAGTVCYGSWSGGAVNSGSCQNGYDANGNLVAKTDNRNITVNYQYDSLNRTTLKSGGGLSYVYIYDTWSQSLNTNGKGRLVGATNNVNADEAFAYDAMGRLTWQANYTPSSPNNTSIVTSAVYDAAGNPTMLTYPDGRLVTQGWNNAGHQNLSTLTSASGQTVNYNYLSSATYLPTGGVGTMTFGNGATQSFYGNGRLQPNEIAVQMNANGTNQKVLDKQLCYGPSTANCSTQGSGKDNGNVWAMADLLKSSATQTFGYDNLNRLTNFAVTDQSASQTYSYDSFGNMNQVAPGTSQSNLSFTANNQIASTGFIYDAAGNLTQASVGAGVYQTMAYNAENKLTSYNNGAATYTYDALGTRVRKDVGSNWTEYISFNGQTLAEKNFDGTWSDYIYAAGQKIALSATYDARLHTHGTCAANCILTWQLPVTGGYRIKSGDKLMWRQYQSGGGQGGMDIQARDSNNNFVQAAWNLKDTAGQYVNYMTTQNQWVNRTVDLSSFANDVVSTYLLFVNSTTPAGSNFDIFHSNIAIVSTDGTVTTLYAGQRGTSIPLTYNYGNNGSNLSGVQETVNSGPTFPDGTTMYYHGDHLGSTRMMTWAGGWPVSADTYHPFGLEPAGASDTNHYRYASLERDAESGFDHATFRQLASTQGRWMSPDPYDGSYNIYNPQSLNRYSYVLNNPLGMTDPSGLEAIPCSEEGEDYTICTVTSGDGPGGGGGGCAVDACVTTGAPSPVDPVGWDPGYGPTWSTSPGTAETYDPGQASQSQAPSNDSTIPSRCKAAVLGAVNSQFGTNFTNANIQSSFMNGGGANLVINAGGLPAGQFNGLQTGRYASGFLNFITGVGPSLHLAGYNAVNDPNAIFNNSNIGGATSVTFTAHTDSAFANNPFGALLHYILDVSKHGKATRDPCPAPGS